MSAAAAKSSRDHDKHAHSEEYEELHAALLKDLGSVKSQSSNVTPDKLGQYFIRANEPLPQFDTTLAKAFLAVDEKDPSRQLFAMICSPKMPLRGRVIKAMQGQVIPHMVPMLSSGLVQLSTTQGRRFVIIYEQPQGKSLAVLFAERQQKSFPEQFLMDKIIGPLSTALNMLDGLGLSHGRLNPANVFFGETVTLGEFASEPCGYSQPYFYEPSSRAQASLAGKGEGTVAQDYYALGMMAAYLRLGDRLFEASGTLDKHLIRLLADSPYQGISKGIDFSDGMNDLLRGTLNDSVTERWSHEQIKPWSHGRRFNMLPPATEPAASRPYFIEQQTFNNVRDLAQGLYMNWDLTIRLLHEGTAIRWVDLSARRKDLAELLRKTVASAGTVSWKPIPQNDEMVARALVILDPQAPLSMRETRMHIDGIGPMMAEAFRSQNPTQIDQVTTIMEHGLPTIWSEMLKKNEQEVPKDLVNALWILDRLRLTLRRNTMGFGVERCLYDLNPDLSCQSPMVGDNHVHNVKELLNALDRTAPQRGPSQPPIDRHVAAFICSRLNITREVWLTDSNHSGKLAKSDSFIALKLFERAYESGGKPSVPGLTMWVALSLLDSLEDLHSRTIKKRMFTGMKQLAESGNCRALFEFVNQKAFIDADATGFKEAINSYRMMRQEIFILSNKVLTRQSAALRGNSFAKQIAYIGLLAVGLFVVHKTWFR